MDQLGITMDKNDFYVYFHRSNISGEIFYVGKGRGLRCNSTNNRSSSWKNKAKEGFSIEFYAKNLTNNEALLIETELIKSLPFLVNVNINTKTKIISDDNLSLVYYDESSPSCLRHACEVLGSNGRVYKKIGDVAGILKPTSDNKNKRYIFRSKGISIYAHRLVYALHYPLSENLVIDHIDGNSLNNKIENLRAVTPEVNSRNLKISENSKTGMTGVSKIKRKHLDFIQFIAHCRYNGILYSKEFSCFDKNEDEAFRLACEWREQKIKELNEQGAGYTDRHGT